MWNMAQYLEASPSHLVEELVLRESDDVGVDGGLPVVETLVDLGLVPHGPGAVPRLRP